MRMSQAGLASAESDGQRALLKVQVICIRALATSVIGLNLSKSITDSRLVGRRNGTSSDERVSSGGRHNCADLMPTGIVVRATAPLSLASCH